MGVKLRSGLDRKSNMKVLSAGERQEPGSCELSCFVYQLSLIVIHLQL